MNIPEISFGEDDFVKSYLGAVADVALCLKDQEYQIKNCVNMLFEAWSNNRWVFVVGNGGSAGTATHFTADLVKTVIDRPLVKGLRALSLVDNVPLTSATTNDWGWDHAYDVTLGPYWETGSVLVVFSVHGGAGRDKAGAWSQNLIRAIRFAKDHGGKTIGLAGFDGGVMKDLCDVCIVVPADSTPLVESFHVVLHHLVVFRLKAMIADCLNLNKEGWG
ncbi:MAG: SIS domain-containing protein [Parcubacteria group bacterium]|nr:SIS domain-containing protein [Parcubacteria group bacterium]